MFKPHTKLAATSVLLSVAQLIWINCAGAQSFATLFSFTNYSYPRGSVSMVGKTLYGTTDSGGDFGSGSVFAVNIDGTGFTNLHSFTTPVGGPPYTNPDGSNPYAGVLVVGNTLYGTAVNGGTGAYGAVFSLNTDGTGFTNLHNFDVSDGYYPEAGLILFSNTLYGQAPTVFSINTDGTGFTNFNVGAGGGGLVLSGGMLYGTINQGGSNGTGSIFGVGTDGSDFTNLYNFSAYSGTSNSDGDDPGSRLILSGNTLFGTAGGGTGGNGTVFSIHTDGTVFTNLHNFAPPPGNPFMLTNSDGEFPDAGLLLVGHTLYGTTFQGGSRGGGTIYSLNVDGSGFTNLHFFKGGSDGYNPFASLIVSGNVLYGTTAQGGGHGFGSIFRLTLPAPQLSIFASSTNVILTWPTNGAGFDFTGYTLQATSNLAAPSWSAVLPPPVIVNGQETVTNPISGTQMFYRLNQ